MDVVLLKDQRDGLVNSMFREGYLDDQFNQLQMLQDANNPGFIAEVISLFCEDSKRILAELTRSLDQAVVDFNKVDAYVHQLKGSSSSIGAHHVKLACIEFRSYCEERNRDGCQQALNVIKNEFYLLRNKLEIMVQAILSYRVMGNHSSKTIGLELSSHKVMGCHISSSTHLRLKYFSTIMVKHMGMDSHVIKRTSRMTITNSRLDIHFGSDEMIWLG